MGIARLLLVGVAVVAVLMLIAVGVRALSATLSAAPAEQVTPDAAPSDDPPPAPDPTVFIECVQDRCGEVFVRIPGGDVLLDRELAGGEQVGFDDEKLDVVLADPDGLRVTVNGEPRTPAEPGERESFTVTRE
ncbi:hypothetical protein Misp01_50670 [Microtetraspora sp. NBRC 13810]|uniref:hypothetical protein n=1 Tax=Microtetraspora sp. NBRC 13810 TaxID=3030990 RepID=UPI0024A5EF9E|nr:hypothetical protein [Microtetraspora sp. NBRC 13810]GLW09938.1 hypothetical protein Misp01_50670 [Microtetraspora sp. NBRC 13810]